MLDLELKLLHNAQVLKYNAPNSVNEFVAKIIPWTNKYLMMDGNHGYVTSMTLGENEILLENGIPKVSGTTSWTNMSRDQFAATSPLQTYDNHDDDVSLEFTGITPRKNEFHYEFATGITPSRKK